MISRATCVWMMLAIGAGIGLFVLKYEVKGMEEKLAVINSETLRNLETVHVLKAEWSYLNQPERLADLGQRLLSMERTDALQMATIADIPLRPETVISNQDVPDNGIPSVKDGPFPPAAGHVPPFFATYRGEQ